MKTLTVTSRGQVTFRKEVLHHLGIRPGDKIELNLLPEGRAELVAARAHGTFRELQGFLKHKTNGRSLSIDEMNRTIAEAGGSSVEGDG